MDKHTHGWTVANGAYTDAIIPLQCYFKWTIVIAREQSVMEISLTVPRDCVETATNNLSHTVLTVAVQISL